VRTYFQSVKGPGDVKNVNKRENEKNNNQSPKGHGGTVH
jgi:hypothetical protein